MIVLDLAMLTTNIFNLFVDRLPLALQGESPTNGAAGEQTRRLPLCSGSIIVCKMPNALTNVMSCMLNWLWVGARAESKLAIA